MDAPSFFCPVTHSSAWRRAGQWAVGFVAALALSGAAAGKPYRIAFGSFALQNAEVFIADGRGAGARPLAPHPALDMNPTFTPDGRKLMTREIRLASEGAPRDGAVTIWNVPDTL